VTTAGVGGDPEQADTDSTTITNSTAMMAIRRLIALPRHVA
jgi:hypothetical protein